MKNLPQKTLPDGYSLLKYLDIRETKSAIVINIFGVVLLVGSWLLFTWLINLIRPDAGVNLLSFQIFGVWNALLYLLEIVAVVVVMLFVHEALHGVFFWLFTKEKPKFAFKGYYAYAAAPNWYMPKGKYLITSLAPLVGITLICLILSFFVGEKMIPALLWMLVLNTSGAVGDLWVVFELLRAPQNCYGRDFGDRVELFTRRMDA